ncbi:MAG: polysaccharide biosynthesis protein [Eubacterium sp.]|nr:polysaccharide biosynthesis protein [Eubacterium sp.]
MSEKNKKSDFLLQGSILAIASIISRIIGLIYRVPLTNIIGDDGNNYYSSAYDVYNILLLISSYSLPLAVSKLVAARMSKGEKKNAYRIFKGALIFAFVTGSIAFLIVYFGAGFFTNLLATPQSYLALKILGPTLLIVAVMGVIRGFFQGMGTMVPSAVSQIIEQIINAIVSVGAAYILFNYGLKVGKIMGNEKELSESYGAAGGTLGTTAGALAALLFLMLVFLIFRKGFVSTKSFTSKRRTESYGSIFVILISTIIPVLLSTTVYNISSIVDQGIFKNLALYQNYSESDISTWWGIFSVKYKVLINVPIAIASAIAASCVPSITSAMAVKDKELVNSKIYSALRFVMIIAFPSAVGLAVLASPILTLLFGDSRQLSALMLQVGACSVIFYSISTVSNAVLQGIDRMSSPVKNAFVALVLHVIVLVGLMFAFRIGVFSVIIANAVFALIMCILNQLSIHAYSGFKQEYKYTYIMPLIASLIMGVCVYGLYKFFMLLCNVNAISTVLSICFGAMVYAVVLIKSGGLSEAELRNFPKGNSLIRLFKKIHLL